MVSSKLWDGRTGSVSRPLIGGVVDDDMEFRYGRVETSTLKNIKCE